MPDIETTRGDSRLIAIPVFDADLDRYRSFEQLDFQVDTVEYVVVDSPDAGEFYIEKDLTDANVNIEPVEDVETVELDDLDGTDGLITIKLDPADTESLPADGLWHECQIVDDEMNTTTIMRGTFEVIQSATNPQT